MKIKITDPIKHAKPSSKGSTGEFLKWEGGGQKLSNVNFLEFVFVYFP